MKTSKTYSSKKKDVLSLMDLSSDEISRVLTVAAELKKSPKSASSKKLEGKCLAMVFQKPSTRTRVSFEVAMYQLGGHALSLTAGDMQLSRGETVEDTGKTLALYADCILARVYDHGDVEMLARSSRVPVINGLSNSFHPCQILADLLTIKEIKGNLADLRVAWLGDGDNVCNDLLLGCAKMGMHVSVACPKGYEPDRAVVDAARLDGQKTGSEVVVTEDPVIAAKEADVIMTDTFVSIGKEDERSRREVAFLPKYQVNDALMRLAKSDAIFMHCLPAKRGQEVTASVIDGKKSRVWEEAENRLHAQKGLLCCMLSAEDRMW